jgi:hypothetical protein
MDGKSTAMCGENTERESENPIMNKKTLIPLRGMKERKRHDIWRLHDPYHIIATQGPNKDENQDPKKERRKIR